jgi:hypothetical protein
MREPGRIKLKLAQMLSQRGYNVDPKRLRPNYGYNNRYWDCCCWTCLYEYERGKLINIFSWDSMADLIKNDFDISATEGGSIEISIKAKKEA